MNKINITSLLEWLKAPSIVWKRLVFNWLLYELMEGEVLFVQKENINFGFYPYTDVC